MKTKGITVVERFIEKGILGLAAVFAVAFAAMQLLSEPPTTKAAGGEVNPGTVDARLEEQTRRLKAAIEVEGLPAGVEVLEASERLAHRLTNWSRLQPSASARCK